jgi:hypothetical protein
MGLGMRDWGLGIFAFKTSRDGREGKWQYALNGTTCAGVGGFANELSRAAMAHGDGFCRK